jgi:hypothetical protein
MTKPSSFIHPCSVCLPALFLLGLNTSSLETFSGAFTEPANVRWHVRVHSSLFSIACLWPSFTAGHPAPATSAHSARVLTHMFGAAQSRVLTHMFNAAQSGGRAVCTQTQNQRALDALYPPLHAHTQQLGRPGKAQRANALTASVCLFLCFLIRNFLFFSFFFFRQREPL